MEIIRTDNGRSIDLNQIATKIKYYQKMGVGFPPIIYLEMLHPIDLLAICERIEHLENLCRQHGIDHRQPETASSPDL